MTTHRKIQLSNLEDKLVSLRNLWYRCAIKASSINNRGAASHWTKKANHASNLLIRLRGRIYV